MQDFAVDKIFLEKVSGKNTDRAEFKNMMSYIREGDVVYVESISRLSRSVRDLLKIIDDFNSKGVKFVSSKENIDTSTPQGRFTLNIFAALSELEREQTLQRQKEGIAIAKEQGKYKGIQPIKINEIEFEKLYRQWKQGKISAVFCQKQLGLSPSTFYRRIKKYEKEGEIL